MIAKLDIIIVNWNSGEYLYECISSIPDALNNGFKLDRVVVVDNASSDDSLMKINDITLPLTIIKNSENSGFAKACNQGAKESDAEFLLFLNPDTRLFENSLYVPLEFLVRSENSNIGIIGVKIIDEKNKVSRNCARFPNPFTMVYRSLGLDKIFPKLFPSHFMTEWDHLDNRFVDQVMGSFFLVRKALYNEIHGFDERFFVYYEDLDFSLRANQKGYLSYYLSDAEVYHKGGGISEKVKASRLFYNLRSKILFAKKHFGWGHYHIILFFSLFIEPFVRIINGLIRGSTESVVETLKGYKTLFFEYMFGRR